MGRLAGSNELCIGVRGAVVLGVHDSLLRSGSQFQIVDNTIVRERFAIFAYTKSQISFEDRHAAFHSLGTLRNTSDTAVHHDTYRYVFL